MRLRSSGTGTVLAAILMPDHLHVIAAPILDREAAVGNFAASIKRWMRRELRATWKFQAGCFDRLLRSDNRFTTNGCMSKRIQSGLDLWNVRKVGPTATYLTKGNCRATASVAISCLLPAHTTLLPFGRHGFPLASGALALQRDPTLHAVIRRSGAVAVEQAFGQPFQRPA
jgi:hypothetical protein